MAAFEALVLKQIPFKESSKILHVYTAAGLRSLLVHGAKKIGSPYLSASENLNLLLVQASGRDLMTLTDADLVDGYPAIKGDLEKLAYAGHLAEILHNFAEAEYDHAKFFAFTKKILAKIAAEADYEVYAFIFELKYLHLLGVAPAFARCAACDKTADLAFHVRAGGSVCPEHAEGPETDAETAGWLRTLYRHDLAEPLAARPDRTVAVRIRQAIDDWYAYHLNFRSKGRTLLSGLRGY